MTKRPPPANRQELIEAIAGGARPKYLFFWGHQQQRGRITQTCLSQWYPSVFETGGHTYLSAEHFMMAQKAKLFGDANAFERAIAAPSPAAAKAIGQGVQNFDEATWTSHRFAIVVEASIHKFEQNKALGDFLRTTGSRVLVEASPVDKIWGIGLAADHAHCSQPERWTGQNLLGFALMQARAQLS